MDIILLCCVFNATTEVKLIFFGNVVLKGEYFLHQVNKLNWKDEISMVPKKCKGYNVMVTNS